MAQKTLHLDWRALSPLYHDYQITWGVVHGEVGCGWESGPPLLNKNNLFSHDKCIFRLFYKINIYSEQNFKMVWP